MSIFHNLLAQIKSSESFYQSLVSNKVTRREERDGEERNTWILFSCTFKLQNSRCQKAEVAWNYKINTPHNHEGYLGLDIAAWQTESLDIKIMIVFSLRNILSAFWGKGSGRKINIFSTASSSLLKEMQFELRRHFPQCKRRRGQLIILGYTHCSTVIHITIQWNLIKYASAQLFSIYKSRWWL